MSDEQSCPFCNLTPAQLVAEHQLAVVVRDAFPLTPGHCLVIPRRHVASFFDCTAEERAAMMELLDAAKVVLDREHRPAAYNLGLNNGRVAGQTVMHTHLHLIPLYVGGCDEPGREFALVFRSRRRIGHRTRRRGRRRSAGVESLFVVGWCDVKPG